VLRVFREYRRKMPKAKSTGSKALDYFGGGGSTATEQHQLHKQQQCASCATNAPSHTHGEAITANTYTTATRALALS